MITDARGNLLVDFVGAYEDLAGDFSEVARVIGIQTELPHINSSVHKDYRTYYNERTRAIVEEHFQPDIERFGYSFDGRATKLVKKATR